MVGWAATVAGAHAQGDRKGLRRGVHEDMAGQNTFGHSFVAQFSHSWQYECRIAVFGFISNSRQMHSSSSSGRQAATL
jgi:hypothetical protein